MIIQYGATTNFLVFYDSSLTGGGQPDGPTLAQAVLDYCEYDLVRLSMLFGINLPSRILPIQITLNPGTDGANNDGVNQIDCACNLYTDPPGLVGLVVIELAEIFMVSQNKGWISSWSNGEALSRVASQILHPNRAWAASTGDSWLNGGRADWVTFVEHTDLDVVSIGCGSLFLNYLAYQLNLEWPAILQAGAPMHATLAETATLLGVANPWQDFINLISANFPPNSNLPAKPIGFGLPSRPTDATYPLGPLPAQVPALYMRHNLADDGTSHTGSLSDSPDIILQNNPVANPQATFSTPASIASDTEIHPFVMTGQANYVYLRVWNRGADAANVFATVYWAPPSTLVTPNIWNLVGSAYYPDVPPGSMVQVSNPGITWPADRLPGSGHYCFVATVGNSYDPAPNSGSFASFDDFVNYIYANNNVTWRNFDVPFHFHLLPFQIVGAWDAGRLFVFEMIADLPKGSRLAIQVPHWIARGLKPAPRDVEELEDPDPDPKNPRRARIPLPSDGSHNLGSIELPAGTAAPSHLLVDIPKDRHRQTHRLIIRQLYKDREVGRITWLLNPPREA